MLRQEAFQEGFLEGFLNGKHETQLLAIRNLMDSTGWTVEKAMDLLKIPLNQHDALYSGLLKMPNDSLTCLRSIQCWRMVAFHEIPERKVHNNLESFAAF